VAESAMPVPRRAGQTLIFVRKTLGMRRDFSRLRQRALCPHPQNWQSPPEDLPPASTLGSIARMTSLHSALLLLCLHSLAIADVRSFGAIGDGKADDTAAIQKAVDSDSGTVRFENGTYRLTRTIAVNLNEHGPVALIGDGTARIVMAGAG